MIHINLLPLKAARKKERLKGQLTVAAAALVVTALLCALVYLQLLNAVQTAKDEIAQKNAEISRLQKIIGEVNEYKKRQEALRAKLDILNKLEKSRRGPVMTLDELYKALPEKLWLEAVKEVGGKINISGVATDEETVALFMKNLEESPQFSQVALGGVQQVVQDGVRLHKFDLGCALENLPTVDLAAAGSPKK
jgi:type IV pilus assembly protein PilN